MEEKIPAEGMPVEERAAEAEGKIPVSETPNTTPRALNISLQGSQEATTNDQDVVDMVSKTAIQDKLPPRKLRPKIRVDRSEISIRQPKTSTGANSAHCRKHLSLLWMGRSPKTWSSFWRGVSPRTLNLRRTSYSRQFITRIPQL